MKEYIIGVSCVFIAWLGATFAMGKFFEIIGLDNPWNMVLGVVITLGVMTKMLALLLQD